MATLFPSAADDATTLPNPTATSKTNNPSISSGQSNQNDAIKAIEAKVGTGASTPTNNTLLRGNGTGTSVWAQLTSAQLAASLSDETGTGAAVFATTPTLVTPKADTINESTPANGVTIDGLNIKDSALTTSNSVVTANITDSAITPVKLLTGTGTSWAWQTWTPTLTNLSGGAITFAKFTQIGKTVHFRFKYTLAGAGVTGSVLFTLPVTAAADAVINDIMMGNVLLFDTGVGTYYGQVAFASTSVASVYALNSFGTYLAGGVALSSTIPHTWASTDIIYVTGTYEAA